MATCVHLWTAHVRVFSSPNVNSLPTCTFVQQNLAGLIGNVQAAILCKLEYNHDIDQLNANLAVKSNGTMSWRCSHVSGSSSKGKSFALKLSVPYLMLCNIIETSSLTRRRLRTHSQFCFSYGRGRQVGQLPRRNQKSHLEIWEGFSATFLC